MFYPNCFRVSTTKLLKGRKTLGGKEDYVATYNDLANTFSYIQPRLSMGATHRTYVRSYATRSGSARTDPAKLQRSRRCIYLHCLHASVEAHISYGYSCVHYLVLVIIRVSVIGQGGGTRTLDLRAPKPVLYQSELRPETLADVVGASPTSPVLTAPMIFCANAFARVKIWSGYRGSNLISRLPKPTPPPEHTLRISCGLRETTTLRCVNPFRHHVVYIRGLSVPRQFKFYRTVLL